MTPPKYDACIAAFNACAAASNHCAVACLQEPDVKTMALCIAWNMDCADMCTTAAAAMARCSEHATEICKLCASICQSCADECAKHAAIHCQQCAQACQAYVEACHEMATVGLRMGSRVSPLIRGITSLMW